MDRAASLRLDALHFLAEASGECEGLGIGMATRTELQVQKAFLSGEEPVLSPRDTQALT